SDHSASEGEDRRGRGQQRARGIAAQRGAGAARDPVRARLRDQRRWPHQRVWRDERLDPRAGDAAGGRDPRDAVASLRAVPRGGDPAARGRGSAGARPHRSGRGAAAGAGLSAVREGESMDGRGMVMDEKGLERWGEQVGGKLRPPLYIALRGDLGAGKSTLARALARGAGVGEAMPSPTFNLLFRYAAAPGVAVVHLDLYRLEDPEEIWELGWED